MLLANLEIGFHEQTRLQPEIERSLHAGADTAHDLKLRLLKHFGVTWSGRAAASVLAFPARYYRRFVRELTRRIILDAFMVLRTPAGILNLNKSIDETSAAVFGQLDLSDLMTLTRKVDPEGTGCRGHGADDWANLDQRMHYIYHLFSAFHEKIDFFQPPFTPEQVAIFNAGRIPNGRSKFSWEVTLR